MRIKYINHRFRASTQKLIDDTLVIAEQFKADGYKLTVRQLYYQLVGKGRFPDERRYSWTGSKWKQNPDGTKNAPPNYFWLVSTLTNARNAGLFDWDMIEDRTRSIQSNPHWDSVSHAIGDVAKQFHFDLWEGQDVRVQVWIEKDALSGVFLPVCQELDVPLLACRGYPSVSTIWSAGRLFREYGVLSGQSVVILHFGDHDPSGIDMTRDLEERLNLYAGSAWKVRIKRIALNMDQIEKYNPPSDPAKTTDSRFADYAREFGDSSWELDALSPKVLSNLARKEIKKLTNQDTMDESLFRQDNARNRLREIATEERIKEDD